MAGIKGKLFLTAAERSPDISNVAAASNIFGFHAQKAIQYVQTWIAVKSLKEILKKSQILRSEAFSRLNSCEVDREI